MIAYAVSWYLANLTHGFAHWGEPYGRAQAVVYLVAPFALLAALIFIGRCLGDLVRGVE